MLVVFECLFRWRWSCHILGHLLLIFKVRLFRFLWLLFDLTCRFFVDLSVTDRHFLLMKMEGLFHFECWMLCHVRIELPTLVRLLFVIHSLIEIHFFTKNSYRPLMSLHCFIDIFVVIKVLSIIDRVNLDFIVDD